MGRAIGCGAAEVTGRCEARGDRDLVSEGSGGFTRPHVTTPRIFTDGGPAMEYPPTLWALLRQSAAVFPDAPVVADDYGRSFTRLGLLDAAEEVAAALQERGVKTTSVVSWQLPTVIESLVLLLALARLDVVQNPLIPVLRSREVGFITKQVGTAVPRRARELARLCPRRNGPRPGGRWRILGGRDRSRYSPLGRRTAPAHRRPGIPTPGAGHRPRRGTPSAGCTTPRAPPVSRRAPVTPTPRSWRRARG